MLCALVFIAPGKSLNCVRCAPYLEYKSEDIRSRLVICIGFENSRLLLSVVDVLSSPASQKK